MGENILYVAVLLLSLYGCVELIRLIALRLLQTDTGIFSAGVPDKRSCKNMEYICKGSRFTQPLEADFKCRILLLDTGMDEHTRKLAEKSAAILKTYISAPQRMRKLTSL